MCRDAHRCSHAQYPDGRGAFALMIPVACFACCTERTTTMRRLQDDNARARLLGHEEEIPGTLNQMDRNNRDIGMSSRRAGAWKGPCLTPDLETVGPRSTPVAMPSSGIFCPRVRSLSFRVTCPNPYRTSHHVLATLKATGQLLFLRNLNTSKLGSTLFPPGRYKTAGLHIAMADSPPPVWSSCVVTPSRPPSSAVPQTLAAPARDALLVTSW